MNFIKQIWLAMIYVLALSMTGLCNPLIEEAEPCLDEGGCDKQQTFDVYDKYVENRDAVVELQGNNGSVDEIIPLVEKEVKYAVRSWIRAACACYLGSLKKASGDADGSKEAFQAAIYYAKKAIKWGNGTKGAEEKRQESLEEGKKYLSIANQILKIKNGNE